MPLNVRQYAPEDRQQWDEFVFRHPHGSPFHLIAWKDSIEETFGYRPLYLAVTEGASIRGVLPLFLVQNFLVGKALISSPFAVYGGILADSAEAREALGKHVESLGQSLQVDYIELRNAHCEQCSGFHNVARYVTFTQQVGPDEKAILEAIPRKTRYVVRRSLRYPFTTRRQTSDFLAFEALYSANLKRLGTPSFPPKHFARLIANFRDMIDVREVLLEGKVVAAVVSFYFRDQVLPYYGAADPRYNAQAPSSYSITSRSLWALDVLSQCGFTHDSSIYPIAHDRYGIPGFCRHAQLVQTASGGILEVPIATVKLSEGKVAPVGGGAYLRLLPYRYTAAGIRRMNTLEGQPACIYFHPWELDPAQPRLANGLVSRIRTYSGLRKMESKLERLLSEFRFSTLTAVHPAPSADRAMTEVLTH